jgi:tRNA threonylcarbamoyladenosine biosynthesis protein TsaE
MQNNNEIIIPSLDHLQIVAVDLMNQFKDNHVWAFEGEMGAGKTTLILEILSSLGITEFEGSPTYSLVNVYDSPLVGKIYHFDLYRLNSIEEAMDIGIEEMLYSEKGLCLIEWPKKIEYLLPEETIWLYLSILEGSDARILRF